MNCEIHSLAPLRCEAFQAKEVLRAVLHTILFTRALGVVRPKDVDCELFGLSYATCGDPAVDAAVEERLDALATWLHRKTSDARRGETRFRVTLSFHELDGSAEKGRGGAIEGARTSDGGASEPRKKERPRSANAKKKDFIKSGCWERWRVPLEVSSKIEAERDGNERDASGKEQLVETRVARALEVQDALRMSIRRVLTLAGETKDHIPPVTTSEAACFPFSVSLPDDEADDFARTALGTLKRMLVNASPPSMLT